jgi:flagellin-like protein
MQKREYSRSDSLLNYKLIPSSKRSQSGIITTVLLILLVIVAVVIVWNVVNFTLKKSANQVKIDQFSERVSIDSVKLPWTGGAEVNVKRDSGTTPMTSLTLTFIGKNGEVKTIKETTNLPVELETRKYNYNSNIINFSLLSVSAAPQFGETIGIESKSDILPSDIEALPNGLVSWWKFEGDAIDKTGINPGLIDGSPIFIDGKIGKAIQFNGDLCINTTFNISYKDISEVAWINISSSFPDSGRVGIITGNYPEVRTIAWEIYYYGKSRVFWNDWDRNFFGITDLRDNKWHMIAYSRNSANNKTKMYIDRRIEIKNDTFGTDDSAGIDAGPLSRPLRIGGDYRHYHYPGTYTLKCGMPFNGVLDELMIFNRSLSDSEILELYNNQK